MMTSEIKEKIQTYIQSHPEMQIYSQDAIISIMADEGILNKNDLENIKVGGSIFGNNNNDLKDFFWRKINADDTPISRRDSLLKLVGLTMDTDGKIDTSNLTEEKIIEKFGKENCTVNKNEHNPKIFININTGEGQLSIEIPNGENHATISVQLENNALIVDSMTNKILAYAEFNGIMTTNYDIHGEISSTFNLKDKTTTEYVNGYSYRKFSAKTDKNLLVEDLIKDINAKNWIGLPTTRDSIRENVLKRITPKNVGEVLAEYKEQTGNDLIKDIKNEWGLKPKLKEELIGHIQSCSPIALAQSLITDIYGLGSGNLEKDIKKINKDNVKEVIKAYTLMAAQKDSDFLKLPTEEDLYLVSEEIKDTMLSGIGSGIIADIMNEWGLSESKCKELAAHIINTAKEAMEEDKNLYSADIKADLTNNYDDYNKLDIDLIRFANRSSVPKDSMSSEIQEINFLREIPFDTPDGQINTIYRQGHTGDCWLISGLSAIISKPSGKEHLNKLIKIDPKTGDVIVTFKGINKQVCVKADTIKNSNQLASGDGDIRAIEIAVDWVLKQLAYQEDADFGEKGKIVDINGNSSSTLFFLLFGDSYIEEQIDKIKQINFNKPNSFATVGFDLEESIKKLQFQNVQSIMQEQSLKTDHSYTILREDDKYIYLYDPNRVFNPSDIDEKDIIKRTKEEFYSLKPYIMGVNI